MGHFTFRVAPDGHKVSILCDWAYANWLVYSGRVETGVWDDGYYRRTLPGDGSLN